MIITKEQFNAMPIKHGGDLWNQYKVCRLVFKRHPEAVSFEYNIGTGLWVDFTVSFKDGTVKKDRIYDQ